MLKIFDAPLIKKIDACTVVNQGIDSIDLMERASLATADYLTHVLTADKPILVFAGMGNNGGDALSVARILLSADYPVRVFLVAPHERYSYDCLQNKKRLEHLTHIETIRTSVDIPFIPSGCVIIDGLFGSGLNRPLQGVFLDVVQAINASHNSTVYSIDMPSGLFVEDNQGNNPLGMVRANEVLTFQFPKLALLLPDSNGCCKKMTVLDIGLCEKCILEEPTDYTFTQKSDVIPFILSREKFSHKGTYGKALLIAGSLGKMGAAVLAARACVRTGVGILTVHAPRCGVDILQTTVPEAMVNPDISVERVSQLNLDLQSLTIGIGPGIGIEEETSRLLSDLLECYQKPMVIDADALNLIARNPQLKDKIPPKSILTPHPTEMDRLLGSVSANGYQRLQKTRDFASQHDVYIVLKGAYSAIVTPKRKVHFNPTGNPGMATGGSGDVLTGILTSLLAQGYSPEQATILGVYIHGMAGDLSAELQSQQAMLPSDMIEQIGQCYRALK